MAKPLGVDPTLDLDTVRVYVAETADGHRVEFTRALGARPGGGLAKIVGVSTLLGCPVRCRICDAGGHYEGRVTRDELLGQVLHAVRDRWPAGTPPCREVRVRFDRMGEPSFNAAVLDALVLLPSVLAPASVVPFLSTVAPARTESFFEKLRHLKDDLYPRGDFLVQVSLHSTDEDIRGWLVPVKLWSFEKIARWGEAFRAPGDRRIRLSFAVAENIPLDPAELLRWFSPDDFSVSLTPVNPTRAASSAGLQSALEPSDLGAAFLVVERFRQAGYDVQLSFAEEAQHGSSAACGQCATVAARQEIRPRRTLGLRH